MRASLTFAFLTAAAAATAAAPLHAQHRYLSALEYSVGIPIGDTHDFISRGSLSGGVWEARWMDKPHTSVGALLGFNEFYRRQAGSFDYPNGTITGDQYRHLVMLPILVTGAYYFTANRDDPRWYVGGGAGAVYTEQLFRLGLHEQRHSDWAFAVVPEFGLAFSAWYGTGGIVALRYHLPTQTSGMFTTGDRRLQYLSLSMGLGFR
jgi:outer membrane protein